MASSNGTSSVFCLEDFEGSSKVDLVILILAKVTLSSVHVGNTESGGKGAANWCSKKTERWSEPQDFEG